MLRGFRPSLPTPLLIALLVAPLSAACRDAPTPLPPLRQEQKPATLMPLPTATPVPATETPESILPEASDALTSSLAIALPEDGQTPVLQFARIEPSPWEPVILAQMHPNFTLSADGRVHYSFAGGISEDHWYQTWLTPTLALEFVTTIWDEIGIAELADTLDAPELRYETGLDGEAIGTGPVGVIYVKTASGSARLVIPEAQLENPSGPYAERISRLNDIIRALQLWREHTDSETVPELVKQGVSSTLGWWIPTAQPFTPEGLLAFGTQARGYTTGSPPIAEWPLQGPADPPLAELISKPYGAAPDELTLSEPDRVLILRTALKRDEGFWGPLWQDASGQEYLIGLRPAVPGGNHVVLDYDYVLPKRGMNAPGSN